MLEKALIAIFVLLLAAAVFIGIYALRKAPLKLSLALAAGLFLVFVVSLVAPPAPAPLSNLLIVLGAIGLGLFISFFLASKSTLTAFCIVIGVIDYFTFDGSLTSKLIALGKAGHVDLFKHGVVYFPSAEGTIKALIGMGDLVALAAIYAGLMENRCSSGLAFLVPTFGLLLALLTGFAVGSVLGVSFMSVTVLFYLHLPPLYGVLASVLYLIFLYLILPSLV